MSASQPERTIPVDAPRPCLADRIAVALAWPQVGYAALVVAIALGAFAIRAWTARLNLPYVDHPDEPNPINYVVAMLRTGDPNPHFFQKPSLYIYLLLAVLSVHYRWGLAQGLYGPLDQLSVTTHVYTTIPGFFLCGRMLTVTIAALTVVCVFRLGQRVWSRGAGLIAALFVALSPFHMRHSQYVTTDVATAWLVLLAFGASIAVACGGRWRDYLAAGAFAGLAASTKYNAGVAALMVCAAHLLFARRAWLRQSPRLIGAGAAAVLGFLAGTPYALISWNEFRRGILGQVQDYSETSHGDFTGAWNIGGYLTFFRAEGLGWAAGVAVLAGLALLLVMRKVDLGSDPHPLPPLRLRSERGWRGSAGGAGLQIGGRAAGLLWLSFVVPYVLLHMAQTSHFTRNMVAVVLLSALPIGVAGATLADWVRGTRRQTKAFGPLIGHLLACICILALLLPSALKTWRYSARLHRGDTRAQAIDWLDANVPPGVRVAAELRALPGPAASRWAEAPALTAHDLAWYRRQGYGYLVASSGVWDQWAIPASYGQLAGRAPVAEFGGDGPRDMLGPHLAIYPTGLSATDAPEPVAGAQAAGARLSGVALGQPLEKTPDLGLRPARRVKAGQVLALRTFWSVEQPFDRDFFIFVHLLDAAGNTVAQRDAPPWQGRFPTSSWRAGSIVVDVNDLPLPSGIAPGSYTVAIGMFDPTTGGHPSMLQAGQPVGQIEVGKLEIVR